jgi:photosystem II stability/assembly factor-like uncharacterized protein
VAAELSVRAVSLAAVLIAWPAAAAGDSFWHVLPAAPGSGGGRHEDVWFATPLDGWVVNSEGRIWNTTDGGESWQQQFSTLRFLRSVTFATPQRGWAGALFTLLPVLYETSDGGATWTEVPDLPAGMTGGICGMWAASESVVYGVGRYSMPAGVLKTTDAGATWSHLDVSSWVTTLVDCWFPTPDFGFVVGSTGHFPDSSRAVVLRTTDGGATWDPRHVSSQLGGWCWKISFPSASVGYVTVERFSEPHFFLKTTDGGSTWTELPGPVGVAEQGVGFVNEDLGWIGGHGVAVRVTTDGGITWAVQGNTLRNLNRVRVVHEGLAYAVGERVYRYSPLDPTRVETLAASTIASLATAPNPFDDSAAIRFSLSRAGEARVAVFDAAGRRVRTLREGLAAAGMHRLSWDGRDARGRDVPAGVYFVRLRTEDGTETRKVQRVR